MIVDDHEVFRTGLRAILEGQEGLTVVSDVASAQVALATIAALRPDVVLLDIGMAGLSGLEALPRLKQASPSTSLLMLSVLEDSESVWTAIRSGAAGYLSKTASLEEIVRGIHAAHAGQFLLGATVAGYVNDTVGDPPLLRLPPLTAREQELLRLLAEGRSTSDMSELLGISPKTVRNYLSNLYTKLAVVDRAQAALAARSALVSMIGPQRRTGRLHAGGVAGVDRFPDRLP